MNNICINAAHISKSFFVPKKRGRTFGVLRSWLSKDEFSKEYRVLRDVTFTIKSGEKVALIGENGTGKTTLLRIISGIYTKTSGVLKVNGNINVFLKPSVGVFKDLSVIDNTYVFGAIYGMERKLLNKKINDILHFADLYDLRFCPEKELSAGQKQRHVLSVIFTIFVQGSDNCLIFDDSLAFVDKNFIKKCEEEFNKLFLSDKTIIIASHDNSFLRKYCRRALWLDKGKIRMDGGINEVIDAYERS